MCVSRFKSLLFLLVLSGCMLLPQRFSAQQPATRSQKGQARLNNTRKTLETQINRSRELLDETRVKQDRSLNELVLINQKIRLQEQLIKTTEKEIIQLSAEIAQTEEDICATRESIDKVKLEYLRAARITYKYLGAESIMLALLSARSFSEAYYRNLYFRQFSRFRRMQLEQLQKAAGFLERKSVELQEQIKDREHLVVAKRDELNLLSSDRMAQTDLFGSLKNQEETYRKRLDDQRKELKKTIVQIESAYLADQERQRKAAEAAARTAARKAPAAATSKSNTKPKSSTSKPKAAPMAVPSNTSQMTAAASTSFSRMKGKLRWPVTGGVVTGYYGTTEDPFGNRIENDGIYINAGDKAPVSAVFSGTVTGVQKVPLSGIVVIVAHGAYRSVYNNLDNVQVKIGDNVEPGQLLGAVRTDERSGESVFQFMIYRTPGAFENPIRWLVKG